MLWKEGQAELVGLCVGGLCQSGEGCLCGAGVWALWTELLPWLPVLHHMNLHSNSCRASKLVLSLDVHSCLTWDSNCVHHHVIHQSCFSLYNSPDSHSIAHTGEEVPKSKQSFFVQWGAIWYEQSVSHPSELNDLSKLKTSELWKFLKTIAEGRRSLTVQAYQPVASVETGDKIRGVTQCRSQHDVGSWRNTFKEKSVHLIWCGFRLYQLEYMPVAILIINIGYYQNQESSTLSILVVFGLFWKKPLQFSSILELKTH